MEEQVSTLDGLVKKFLSILAVIMTVGMVMVWSASFILASEKFGTSLHYITRQVAFLALSVVVAFVVSRTKYNFWIKFGYWINIAASMLVALTIVKGIGSAAKGASRWLTFGGFSLQPGEIVKFTVILSALSFFENWNKMDNRERLKHGATLLCRWRFL